MENNPNKQPATPLWQKSSGGAQARLRQPRLPGGAASGPSQASPRQPEPEENRGGGTVPSTVPDLVSNSKLNVDAPEFCPGSYGKPADEQYFPQNVQISFSDSPAMRNSAQSRLNKYRNSTGSSSQLQCNGEQNGHSSHSNGHVSDDADIARLKQLISSLKLYPGQFDDLLGVFMETIYPYFDDILAMGEIAKILVSEAIESSNFRYNSARLCWYVEQKCAAFRAELHLRCQKELRDNQNQPNVVLFIAELYTQLPHSTLYGLLLVDALKKLIESGGQDNVKVACQAIKLTGYFLEQSNGPQLDEVFDMLRSVKNSLTGSAMLVMNSVINLRESNWGRSAVEPPLNPPPPVMEEQDYEDMVNSICYEGDGGEALTNEEQEFLAAQIQQQYLIDSDDPDALCNPEPEMDEEIQAAFEEFVRLSKSGKT